MNLSQYSRSTEALPLILRVVQTNGRAYTLRYKASRAPPSAA